MIDDCGLQIERSRQLSAITVAPLKTTRRRRRESGESAIENGMSETNDAAEQRI